MENSRLPVPPHYDEKKVGSLWKVQYEDLLKEAESWSVKQGVAPASEDQYKICLFLVDMQNTFCSPEFELFVGGRSGTGAVEDCRRTCEFIYRNLGAINHITATLDTHQPIQVFHSLFLIDENGKHPDPFTLVSADDIRHGIWKFNTAVAPSLGITPEYGQKMLEYYTNELKHREKFDLTIWPYHAMLGSIGHAFVPSVEEAIFFHSAVRYTQPDFNIKGRNPLTEHYSAIGPEITRDHEGDKLADKNDNIIKKVYEYDALIIAGEAKSHCVAWTLDDLMHEINKNDSSLLEKIYLLEDCTSPVVIPGVVDYSDIADETFNTFSKAGMNIVRSTDPIEEWPGVMNKIALSG